MAAPWLSVVMPVHGGRHHLPATLGSVVAEKPEGVEFLIYDSSPDTSCRDIVAAHEGQLNIRYVAMPDVSSWPDKTNRAVADASAPHIAMLHQDDLWLSGHVQAVRAATSAHPDAAINIAASRFIDDGGRDVGPWALPFAPGIYPGHSFGQRLVVQNVVAIPSPAIRREDWLAVGGLDASLWFTADWDLYLKLARRGNIVVRPQVTTAFRIHGNSLTMTGSRDEAALRAQLEIVLDRHGEVFGIKDDPRLRARALASVDINCWLARGAAGQKRWIWPTVARFLRLGPVNAWRYAHESRLADRAVPRLRARLAGNL